MCVRASAMAKAGGFNTQLGRDGSALPISCEETEWCLRATRMTNGIFMFDPDAVIHHKVPTSRLTWSYLVVRCFAEGVSKARLSRLIPSTGALGNEKRYVWQAFTQTAGRELRAAGHGDLPALGRLMALWLGIGCAAAGYMGSTLLTAAKTAISSQFGLKKTPPISTTANGSEPLKTVAGYDAKPHNL